MTLKPHYLYVILLVLLSIYFIYKYNDKAKAKSVEGYRNLNLPSFDEYMKYSQGYKCDENLDTLPYELKSKYDIKSFCDEYPNLPTLDKLSTKLVEKPLLINQASIRKFTTEDINVNINTTGDMNKDNSNMRLSSVPQNANLGHFNLMQSECVDKCKESDLCEYAISANNGDPKLGTCYLFNRKLDLSKVKQGSSIATNTMFSKINSVEYSVATWIKIDKVNNNWRNIMRVGDQNVERFPALFITPKSLGIHASLTSKGKGEQKGWGNTEGLVAYNVFQPKKWHHVAFTLVGKTAKLLVDGKVVAEKHLQGYAQWPGVKKTLYVSDPWHANGDFTLAKMTWYPFALSDAFVKNIALSTFPLEKFKKNIVVGSAKIDPEKIILTNGWVSVNESGNETGKVSIKDVGDIAFIDGIIKGGSPNTVIGFLPQSKIPDRQIYISVAGDNGRYLIEFNPNGNVVLYDNGWFKNRQFAKYTDSNNVYLTARFPFSKGSPLKTSSGYWISQPGYRPKGSVVYLTGGIKSGAVSIPDTLRPSKSDLYMGVCTWKPTRVDVRNNGSTFNVFGNNNTSLEGISYSRFNGERLKLESGFRNYSGDNGYWSYGQVIMNNGIVYLKGLLSRGNFLSKNIKSSSADDENMYSSSPAGDSQWKKVNTSNKKQCEQLAEKTGNKYYKIDDGSCHLAPVYNTIKPSWNQFSKDMAKLPGMIPSGSKLMFTKDNSIMKNISSNSTNKSGKSLIPFFFNKNGSFYVKSSDYNKKNFQWDVFYKAAKKFKVTQFSKKDDSKSYIAITPADINQWNSQIPSSLGGMAYLAPPKNDTKNPFIVLDSNTKFEETTRNIDKPRYIDFTSKVSELRDGEYELRQYNKNNQIIEKLVTFEIRMGEYKEYSNIIKNSLAGDVYQVDLRSELVAKLPMKYRPMETHFFMANAHNGFAIIKIDTDGNVILKGHIGTSWRGFSLAGISYVVDPIQANRREYKFAMNGECRGKEVLKYANNSQNPGSWEDKVDRCAKACEDEKDMKGFLVYPRGSSKGRCWCEAQHDGTCEKVNSSYKRYTFTDASRGSLVKYPVKTVLSWNQANKFATSKNGRLPTQQELKDSAVNRENIQITNVSGDARYDFWHPVSRTDKKTGDWVQIGLHYKGKHGCRKYCSHFDTWGKTSWGDRTNWTYYRPTGYKNRDFIYIWKY